MLKEILIYNDIHSWTATDFINSMNEVGDNDELVVRINSNGGSPTDTFGMVSKFQEFDGVKTVKVDGKAHSMGLFFLAYADQVEALDVSEFLLHRAAFPSWIEQSSNFTDELKGYLANINKSLRAAIEAKIDVEAFEKMKGVTMDEIFSIEDRKDVFITAKEAKKIGLINTINTITPKKKERIEARMMDIAAKYSPAVKIETPIKAKLNSNSQNNQKMTLEEFKAEHPAMSAKLIAEGEEKAITSEKDRVGAWMKFNHVDPKAVAAGIESGEGISQTAMADFSMKIMSVNAKKELADESAETIVTPKAEGEMTDLEKLEAKMDSEMKIS